MYVSFAGEISICYGNTRLLHHFGEYNKQGGHFHVAVMEWQNYELTPPSGGREQVHVIVALRPGGGMAYAGDLKSPDAHASCGFDPHPGHHPFD